MSRSPDADPSTPRRGGLLASALLLSWACAVPSARAESLRCSGGSVAEGDSRLAVMARCGEPSLRDSYCAPVQVVGDPLPGGATLGVCQPVDEWLYDRGPGNLSATVRFRNGVVQTIVYGRVTR